MKKFVIEINVDNASAGEQLAHKVGGLCDVLRVDFFEIDDLEVDEDYTWGDGVISRIE